jgi:uncharacterized linocin/CFP29 family protein
VYKNIPVEQLGRYGLQSPVTNATTLTAGGWRQIDQAVVLAARKRLRAWDDLAGTSKVSNFDAFSKMTYEYQTQSDPGEARVDLEALTEGRTDLPLYDIRSVPLPIIHSDFYFSQRHLAVARAAGNNVDTVMAEAAGRRIAETAEQILIGTLTGMTFGTQTAGYGTHTGTSTVYGYTTFPDRITKTDLTTPTGSNPDAILSDVLEMIELLQTAGFYGPYMLYTSTGYSRFLSDDYFRSGSTSAVRSVRERLLENEDILDIRRLDYLSTGFQMLLVQMDSTVVQAIEGMPIRTLQWDVKGGLLTMFKVMTIMGPAVPLQPGPGDWHHPRHHLVTFGEVNRPPSPSGTRGGGVMGLMPRCMLGMSFFTVVLAQEAASSSSASAAGWSAFGLTGLILGWIFLKHLPDKDRQIKTMLTEHQKSIEVKDARIDVMMGNHQKSLDAMMDGNQKALVSKDQQIERMLAAKNEQIKVLTESGTAQIKTLMEAQRAQQEMMHEQNQAAMERIVRHCEDEKKLTGEILAKDFQLLAQSLDELTVVVRENLVGGRRGPRLPSHPSSSSNPGS